MIKENEILLFSGGPDSIMNKKKLCFCGCNNIIPAEQLVFFPNSKYIRGHNVKVVTNFTLFWRNIDNAYNVHPCECGCGQLVSKDKRVVLGHFMKTKAFNNLRKIKSRTIKVCEWCKKEFEVIEGNKKRFCSNECAWEWQKVNNKFILGKDKVSFVCDNCGKVSSVIPSWYKKGLFHHFCSWSCWIEYLRKHPETTVKWINKEQVERYWLTKEWNLKKTGVLVRDRFTCQRCDKTSFEAFMHVNHIVPFIDIKEHYENNLITFCSSCHRKMEYMIQRKHIKSNSLLLFSGGIDSLVGYFYLNRPSCLYVALRHRYMLKEYRAVSRIQFRLGNDLTISKNLDLKDSEKFDSTIPLRNALLLSIASEFIVNKDDYDKYYIYLIVQKGEVSIPDRKPEFFEEISKFLSFLWEKEVVCTSPFFEMTKSDVIKWYLDNVGNIDLLKETVGCFSEGYGNCGLCQSCLRRAVSLYYNNIECLDWFVNDVRKNPFIPEYINKMKKGLYDEQRTKETLSVFEKWGYKV